MKIQTKYHGEVTVDEADIICFDKGIPGFLEEKKFVILPLTEEHVYFVMQSAETAELAFVITNPFLFFKDYEFKLEDAHIEQLEIEKPEDVQVYTILTIREPFEKTTVNLQAPVIINGRNNRARQVVLNDGKYTIRHPLFHPEPAGTKG